MCIRDRALSSIGPKLLGGLEKVKAACKELEAKMGSSLADEPGFMPAARPVTFRALSLIHILVVPKKSYQHCYYYL